MACYDESGNLKAGMEDLAEYALNELNTAMGTDYSTEFIAQAGSSTDALKEISTEIDNCIAKLQQQSIATAFQSDYAEALKNQADAVKVASEAETTYTEAVENQKAAQAELTAALNASDATTAEGIKRQTEARRKQKPHNRQRVKPSRMRRKHTRTAPKHPQRHPHR